MELNTVLTALLLIFTAVNATILGIFALKFYKIYRDFVAFVTPEAEDKASQFAEFVKSVSVMAGRAIAIEVKTTLMGKASAQSRAETAIESAVVQDAVTQANPLAGGLMSMFPTLGKKVSRNPALLQLAMQMLARSNVSGGGNNHLEGTQAKFKL